MLAARTATEVRPGQHDRCAFISWLIQDEIWIRLLAGKVAPIIEQYTPESLPRLRLQKLLGHHLIRIHVDAIERQDQSCMFRKRLHHLLRRALLEARTRYSVASTFQSRMSTKWPAIAAAAA